MNERLVEVVHLSKGRMDEMNVRVHQCVSRGGMTLSV